MIATVTAGEQPARRLADCFAEAFFADAAAVSLVDAGQGRWFVTCYFRAKVSEAAEPGHYLIALPSGMVTSARKRL